MAATDQPPLRKLRLAVAYLLLIPVLLVSVMAFFYVKDLLPSWLVHPGRYIWLILLCRLAVQIAIGSAVLAALLFGYYRVAILFLTERELEYIAEGFRDS